MCDVVTALVEAPVGFPKRPSLASRRRGRKRPVGIPDQVGNALFVIGQPGPVLGHGRKRLGLTGVEAQGQFGTALA